MANSKFKSDLKMTYSSMILIDLEGRDHKRQPLINRQQSLSGSNFTNPHSHSSAISPI